ncbi:hypothetical protein EDD34_2330 [Myceligenerans xiligouense]|uniref:Uncharacterized protein n=1 Tax=Myceligenerans xiligouense TaxID=253184 RepID=A0A3N4Z794_9MICO|nr:hypothetical protein EDD34_2330 [Myceligenerans xiligouense]
MRVFQTQDEALDTGELRDDDDAATRGRQITQVFYDTAGRTWKQTSPQYATGLVTDTPVQPELIADSATHLFQVEQTLSAHLGEHRIVQLRPHAGLGPLPQTAPARDARDTQRLSGDLAPADPVP